MKKTHASTQEDGTYHTVIYSVVSWDQHGQFRDYLRSEGRCHRGLQYEEMKRRPSVATDSYKCGQCNNKNFHQGYFQDDFLGIRTNQLENSYVEIAHDDDFQESLAGFTYGYSKSIFDEIACDGEKCDNKVPIRTNEIDREINY